MSSIDEMKNQFNIDDDFLSALSDKTRQEIITFFYGTEEACVSEIASRFTLSRPAISHHLILMRKAKILNSRKEGKEMYYSFNKEYVVTQLENLTRLIKKCC